MSHSVEYYLARGCDRKAAEYFARGRQKIISASPNADFTLTIRFENGEARLLDMSPLLQKGAAFAPLRDPEIFRRVYVDETHCIAWDIDPAVDSAQVWSNRVDLCPDTCYLDSVPLETPRP